MGPPSYNDVQLFIDGQWGASASGRVIDVLNPSDERVIGTVARASAEDLERAARASERGFRVWSAMSAYDRYRIMRAAAVNLRTGAEETAQLMTLEQGKPIGESRVEVMTGADIIDWFAEEGRRTYGRVIPSRASGVAQTAIKEPVGPVAAFTPWNFPINQVVRKVSAALAAGCSIIVKGPEETPASVARLVAAFSEACLPAGVLNLVFGMPSEVSEYLIPHPLVRKISFTGSTKVGKQLAALAGLHMKRTTMELGGHAPVLVMADVDIARAVGTLSTAKYRNAGQTCISPTRFLVAEPIYRDFVEQFARAASSMKVGDGLAEGTQMGPLVAERRIEAVGDLVHDAVTAGARLVTGGRRIGNKGYFYEPTVLAEVPTEARAMSEEPFGPVALMVPVKSLDDALEEANRLDVGLAAYAYGGSAYEVARIFATLRAGMVSVNHHGLGLPEIPFGGVLDSGHGTEGGADALEPYLNTKFLTYLTHA